MASDYCANTLIAVAGCTVAVMLFVSFAPNSASQNYSTVTRGAQTSTRAFATLSHSSQRAAASAQNIARSAVQEPTIQYSTVAGSQPGKVAVLVSGAIFFMGAAISLALRSVAPQKSEALALMSTSGEKTGPALSRRDMGPLLTGVMLSPALAAQTLPAPAIAADGAASEAAAVVIESPKLWIKENLPGALRGKDFVRLTADILNRQGMSPENTVACVGVCRDELCQPLVDSIESEWGDAFNMTSLGGMLTLGKTGLKAAMAHSPVDSKGRERYFFLAFPHISVDTAGVGICTRPGRPKPSKACGALYAFTSELQSGKVDTQYNAIDPEYSFMKQALLELIPEGDKPDLLDVTKTAAEASLQQMEQLIAATVDTKKADYAICIGVLVHEQDLRGRSAKVIGPARQYVDQVWPTAFYSVVNGRKKDLIWRLEID